MPFILLFMSTSLLAATHTLDASKNLAKELQEAVIKAIPGDTIILPKGEFEFKDEVIVNTSHITIEGQGLNETILDFTAQEVGAQGILANKDAFTLKGLSIINPKGDGVKVEGSNHVQIIGVGVKWTRGPHTDNGAYGLYPVQTQNVLIEKCVVSGASDAGVYVGQSRKIIVRDNMVEWNVAGIEIENSQEAEVYDNHTRHNTAGILVFDLPNLRVKGGKQTRVYNNLVEQNNTPNFAPKGNIVGIIPSGTGILVFANDDIEIFNNEVYGNVLASIAVVNYKLSGLKILDPDYDPKPERIYIHDNKLSLYKNYEGHTMLPKLFESEFHTLIYFHAGFNLTEILYDGIDDGTYFGKTTKENRFCLKNNITDEGERAGFLNMHLDSGKENLFGLIPGGPASKEQKEYQCEHTPLRKVAFDPIPEIPTPPPVLTAKETEDLCEITAVNEPNYKAFNADCPKLSDYNLFRDPTNPREDPLGDFELPYELSSKLFTDYAIKHRFIFLPPGEVIDFQQENQVLTFPIGTIITKSFSYPESFDEEGQPLKTLETRLLIRRDYGWVAREYVWDHDKQEAFLTPEGAEMPIEFMRKGKKVAFNYQAPSQQKCLSCHVRTGEVTPIGPRTIFMNHEIEYSFGKKNQLEYMYKKNRLVGLHSLDKLEAAPDAFDTSKPLHKRAKAYIDINCAHCHSPTGRAKTSGMFLEYHRPHDSVQYGFCKPPVAAGKGAGDYQYGIQPGTGKKSIITHRMNSSDMGVMMPEVGRVLIHKEGVELVTQWIDSLDKNNCL